MPFDWFVREKENSEDTEEKDKHKKKQKTVKIFYVAKELAKIVSQCEQRNTRTITNTRDRKLNR